MELNREIKAGIAARRMGGTEEPTQYMATFNDLYEKYLEGHKVKETTRQDLIGLSLKSSIEHDRIS